MMAASNMLSCAELDSFIRSITHCRPDLKPYLEIQLGEIKILQAIFEQDKEFMIDNVCLEKAKNYMYKNSFEEPPLLEYFIKLIINNLLLEIQVHLPKFYPIELPDVFVRCNQFARNQQIRMNHDLRSFLFSLETGTVCVYGCILWINHNIGNYSKRDEKTIMYQFIEEKLFSRYWIYSYHIFSKEKKREIICLAKKYNITGFCLPGKPGIICGEGSDNDCFEWWQKIKSMTWKKILCKKIDQIRYDANSNKSLRKFGNFTEITFSCQKNNKSNENRMNMGKFYYYLLEHGCAYIFKDYFRIDRL